MDGSADKGQLFKKKMIGEKERQLAKRKATEYHRVDPELVDGYLDNAIKEIESIHSDLVEKIAIWQERLFRGIIQTTGVEPDPSLQRVVDDAVQAIVANSITDAEVEESLAELASYISRAVENKSDSG
jgi:AmiR/NasT family two-component response regulator